MTTFHALPGTRLATSTGEVQFDDAGEFETADPTVSRDVAAHLAASPWLVELPPGLVIVKVSGLSMKNTRAELVAAVDADHPVGAVDPGTDRDSTAGPLLDDARGGPHAARYGPGARVFDHHQPGGGGGAVSLVLVPDLSQLLP